jgi:hypothetical protein
MTDHRKARSWIVKRLAIATLLWAAAVSVTAPAASASAQEEGPAESMEFQAVEGPQTEDVPGGPLLLGAYAIFLLATVLFVVRVSALQARTARDLDRLEKSLASASDEKDAGDG